MHTLAFVDWAHRSVSQDSSKGGALETGCSDVYIYIYIHMMLCTNVLCNATPIRCTPLRLNPPVMNTQS